MFAVISSDWDGCFMGRMVYLVVILNWPQDVHNACQDRVTGLPRRKISRPHELSEKKLSLHLTKLSLHK